MEKTKIKPLQLLKGCSTFINSIMIIGVSRQREGASGIGKE